MSKKLTIRGEIPESDVEETAGWAPSLSDGRKRHLPERGVDRDDVAHYVACIVNPRDLKPYFAYHYSRFTGVLAVPSSGKEIVIVGHGYLEERSTGDGLPAAHFLMPRVHTPSGVAEKGTGVGTALYVSMATVGTYVSRKWPDRLPYPGDGVCSGEGASSSAQAWWERAAAIGLALEEEYAGEKEEEEEEPERRAEGESLSIRFDDDDSDDDFVWPMVNAESRRWSRNIGGQGDYEIDGEQGQAVVTSRWGDSKKVDLVDWEICRFTMKTVGDLRSMAKELAANLYDESPEEQDATELEVTWSVEAYTYEEVEEEVGTTEHTGFALPIDHAIKKRLVLDLNRFLEKELDEPLGDVPLLDVILNLDLSDVLDPVAVRYFYGLADNEGASHGEMNRFRNRVEAARSYFASHDTPDLTSARADLSRRFGEYRIANPVLDDRRKEAARLFGPLSRLLAAHEQPAPSTFEKLWKFSLSVRTTRSLANAQVHDPEAARPLHYGSRRPRHRAERAHQGRHR